MSNIGTMIVENYWNETLRKVEIHYHNSDNPYDNVFIFYNLSHATSSSNVNSFPYSTTGKSAWKAKITTKNNELWSSGDFLPCQINNNDNGKVTIRFDGETKSMHVNYPVSVSCAKKMQLI
ncbi:hypothetical protein K6N86_001066 [Providencia rettgeri]|nr:hypothetical protein [Providencia rettgeri]